MCYSIPGIVKDIKGTTVLVDYFGEEKKARNEFYKLEKGDYVSAQGGFIIKKIPEDEAKSILSAWKELFFQLQDVDRRLSDFKPDETTDKKLRLILDKAMENIALSRNDLTYLLNINAPKDLDLLLKAANFIRQKYHKNSCCVHGIIEISNDCLRNCFYCGISIHNKEIPRYHMKNEEVIESAVRAVSDYGFGSLILQSAETASYTIKDLSMIVKKIKEGADTLIGISFGEIGVEGLKELYNCGARALLLRFETSNEKLYCRLNPNHDLSTRIKHLKAAKDMGYLIMTGALIGLPGQTNDDIINDLYLAKELGCEMYSFGPFIPHPSTPLGNHPACNQDLVLKVIALARIIDPLNAKIPVTTAFETLSIDARKKGLMSGANSLMINVTPISRRKLYSIYPDKAHINDGLKSQVDEVIKMLKFLGRAPADLGLNKDEKNLYA
ncbi:MAG: radical SAM protein [Candidatus Omnitrophota bacterium]